MVRYLKLIKGQIKRLGTDNLMLVLSVYPFFLAVVGKFLVPFLRDTFIGQFDMALHYPAILAFFILANPYIYGALAALMLLDEREENVIQAIRVTPFTLGRYMVTKVVFFVIVSVVSGMVITEIVGLVELTLVESFIINGLLSLAAPFNMILINSFAKNRVEGFAVIKGTGIMIMLPLVAFYIPESYNLIAGVVPGYWPAMAIRSIAESGFGIMPYWGYSLVGFAYITILIKLLNHKFEKNIS